MTTTTTTTARTFGQTAQRLCVGVLTVRAWVRCEQCPVVKVGASTCIPASWVDGLLAAGRR